jgi:hypothetical protein
VDTLACVHRNDDFHPQSLAELGLDRDFQDAVPMLAEDPISFDNVVKRHMMGNQWREIEPPVSDQFHQAPHPLFAAWTKGRDNPMVAYPSGKRLVGYLELA